MELSRFVNHNLRDAYTNLIRARLLQGSGSGQACALLAEHLQAKVQETVEMVLRVLVGAAFGVLNSGLGSFGGFAPRVWSASPMDLGSS